MHSSSTQSPVMPKLKTNRGAAKRFKRTGSGKLRRSHANTSHILTKMAPKRKSRLAKAATVSSADQPAMDRMLPYKEAADSLGKARTSLVREFNLFGLQQQARNAQSKARRDGKGPSQESSQEGQRLLWRPEPQL